MLTLTRRVGEQIRIGDDIVVTIKEIRRSHVRVGLLAPKDVKILREEIWREVQAEKAATEGPNG